MTSWKYDIQHGPEGEDTYAWVYDDHGVMVATMKTHNAKKIVDRMNDRPASSVEELERYDISMFGNGAVEMGGGAYIRFDQAEAVIAAKEAELKAAQEHGNMWFKDYSDLRESFKLSEIKRRKLESQLADVRKVIQEVLLLIAEDTSIPSHIRAKAYETLKDNS